MGIVLIDQDEQYYQLPASLVYQDDNFDGKIEKFNVAFSDGERTEGDEIKARQVTVSGLVYSNDRYQNSYQMDDLKFWASKPNLRIYPEGFGQWFLRATRLASFDHKWVERMNKEISRVTITWQIDYPYKQADDYAQHLEFVYGSEVQTVDFGVEANPSGHLCTRGQSPIITVTATDPVPSFTLKNLSDQGLQFRYSDPNLKDGAAAIINCLEGTVKLDTTPSERYFEGEFLRLVNGYNNLQYIGPAATISVLWRPRWL